MKKLICLLAILFLATPLFAEAKFGFEVAKLINQGYEVNMIVDQSAQSALPFLPGAYTRSKLGFVAPRNDFFSAMKQLDHSYFQLAIGGNFTLWGGTIELETSLVDHFAKAGQPEYVDMANTWRWFWLIP
jgi:hypothetical protein